MTISSSCTGRWLPAALLGIALVGCGGSNGGARSVVDRFIDRDPDEIFDRAFMVTVEPVGEWSFRRIEDLDGWRFDVDPNRMSISPTGLMLRPTRQFVTMERDVELDAARVDGFELRIKGLRRHPVAVEWAAAGQKFSDDRKVVLERGRDAPGGFMDHHIVTAGHPRWKGTIKRIRFSLTLPRARRATLDHVRALTESIPPEQLAAVVARPWKVSLSNDVRSALLAVPGEVVRRRLTVPEGGELWVSYGVQPRVLGHVVFRVAAVRADGSRVPLSESPPVDASRGWVDDIVDLGRLAGEDVILELATEPEEPFDPEIGFPVWANPEVLAGPGSSRPNVVLISIDTLRADHLSLYGYSRTTSPHIDAWARSGGVVFEQVVASAPWTLPSHVSLFTGLDAMHHGVNHNRPAPGSLVMLAETMRRAGYATVAVTGGGFVHPTLGFAQGFDQYWSYGLRMGFDEEIEKEVDRASEQLERFADRPFFLFFHTYEVHNPFRPRQPYFDEFSDQSDDVTVDVEHMPQSADDGYLDHRRLVVQRDGKRVRTLGEHERDLAVDLYDAGIAYTDSMVARLLRRLEHLGIEERTLVVLTSDHGEMFGEHGVYNHVSLYEGNLMVPLIIVDPKRRVAARVPDQVRLVDVAPTVLELVGLNGALESVDGVSLVPLMDGGEPPGAVASAWSYAAASNYGVSLRDRGARKYVVRNDPWPLVGPVERFVDLVVDPDESARDLPADGEGRALRDLMERRLQTMPGLRLRIAVPADGPPLNGSIRADQLYAQRVKTLRPGCGCLSYGPRKEAHFSSGPGEVHDILLESVGRRLTIELASGGTDGGSREFVLDLAELEGVAQLTRDGAEWSLDMGDRPVAHGIAVWWHGGSGALASEERAVDDELRRQLEALGYVE